MTSIPTPTREWPTALQPLQTAVFRMLWLAWLAANVSMWMNDVAAAWLMTSLTDNPAMVALVQAASTLPVFLLGLPSGAMADIVDRRRYFAATQLWVAANALVLAVCSISGALSAQLLLALTFVNGIGLAMRWPVFAAIVPDVVTREHLPAALALNGVAMNMSRVIGPVVAGALLASLGSAWVFGLNALLSVGAFALILRWRSEQKKNALPGERFVGAMRVGLQHVMQSPRMRVVLARIFLFFLHSVAVTALLPLVAKRMHGGGAGTFTVLLAALGAGAIFAVFYLPRLRERFERDEFVRWGTLTHAAMSVLVAYAPNVWLALPAMFVAGMAWISTANSLTVAAQMALPNWVRARGMAVYQMALMGGSAAGAALWGQVASFSNVPASITISSASTALLLLLTRGLRLPGGADEDLSPARPGSEPSPVIDLHANDGPVLITIEYLIDPAQAEEFAAVMQETRRARLRQGALSWGLFQDTEVAGRYIEYLIDESWVEHLRRLERFTAADIGLRERRMAFHLGEQPPQVKRYVAQAMKS